MHYFDELPLFCNPYPASHGRRFSRFSATTTTVRAFVLIGRNAQNFLELPFPRVHYVIVARRAEHDDAKSKSNSIQIPKPSSFSTPRHKPNQFRSLHSIQVKFDPLHSNQVNIGHPDKNHTISMLTLKPSDLRPASKNESISTITHTKNQISISLHLKQVNFGSHTVNFDPPKTSHCRSQH